MPLYLPQFHFLSFVLPFFFQHFGDSVQREIEETPFKPDLRPLTPTCTMLPTPIRPLSPPYAHFPYEIPFTAPMHAKSMHMVFLGSNGRLVISPLTSIHLTVMLWFSCPTATMLFIYTSITFLTVKRPSCSIRFVHCSQMLVFACETYVELEWDHQEATRLMIYYHRYGWTL